MKGDARPPRRSATLVPSARARRAADVRAGLRPLQGGQPRRPRRSSQTPDRRTVRLAVPQYPYPPPPVSVPVEPPGLVAAGASGGPPSSLPHEARPNAQTASRNDSASSSARFLMPRNTANRAAGFSEEAGGAGCSPRRTPRRPSPQVRPARQRRRRPSGYVRPRRARAWRRRTRPCRGLGASTRSRAGSPRARVRSHHSRATADARGRACRGSAGSCRGRARAPQRPRTRPGR